MRELVIRVAVANLLEDQIDAEEVTEALIDWGQMRVYGYLVSGEWAEENAGA